MKRLAFFLAAASLLLMGQEEGCDTEDTDADGDGWTVSDGDCDDNDAEVHPGADEICDGKDTDCDDSTGDRIDADTDGYTLCAGDCDDNDAELNPAAIETCDEVDNDCDGNIDNALEQTWYRDADADGYGTDAEVDVLVGCDVSGWALEAGDCDDADESIHPGAEEICDEIDNDCDGSIEERGNEACPANDCTEVLETDSAAEDGEYWIGSSVDDASLMYCDFSSSGGPWTYVVGDGLVAYWSFDGSDVTAADVGEYWGSAYGATSQSSFVYASDFNYSVYFDNDESSYIAMSSGPTFGMATTVSYWQYGTSCSNNQIPIMFSDDCSFMGDQLYRASWYICGSYVFRDSSENVCADGYWHHNVYIDTGSEIRVYWDGVQQSNNDGYSYGSSEDLTFKYFGSRPGFGTNGMAGYLDDVAVFDRALDEEEVLDIYAQGVYNGHPLRWQ